MRLLSIFLMAAIAFPPVSNGQIPILVTDASLRLLPVERSEEHVKLAVVLDHEHEVIHGSGFPLIATIGIWSYGVCSDENSLQLIKLDMGVDLLAVNAGIPPAFHVLNFESGGFTQGVIVDLFSMNSLAPGSNQELAVATYGLQPWVQESKETSIEFCDSLGQPTTQIIFIAANVTDTCFVPQQESIGLSINSFRRGDLDNSGGQDIFDLASLLAYLFYDRSLACQMAADCDANGNVNIGDALALLGSLFGNPAIPLPFPFDSCGVGLAPCDLDAACP